MRQDPAVEWRRLSEHYQSLNDDDLQELAADMVDLTDTAQQALREEMKRRRLSDSSPPSSGAPQEAEINEEPPRSDLDLYVPPAPGTDEDQDSSETVEYTWKTALCDCETREQARQLTEALRRAGIDSWLRSTSRRFPQIMVAADQLEQARMIAAQPIPAEIVAEVKRETEHGPEYFEMPVCPKCGAQDPLLLGVDPANQWRCEACGKEWAEAEAATPA
jgi:hypothetical protein